MPLAPTYQPLRLLLLTFQGGMAGSTQSIFFLANGLAQRGHSVYVGCPEDSLLYQLLEKSKAQRIAMTFRSKFDTQNMRHIAQVVRQYDIQLINAQSSLDRYTAIFANLFYRLNLPIIHTRRQTPKSMGGRLQNWFYTRFTRQIVAVSEGVKAELVQLGIPAHHITVIYNGTPPEKYQLNDPQRSQVLREQYGISPNDIVIGCISRYKQQEQLLRAINLLPFAVTVLLVGISEIPAYKRITDTYQLPHRVIYTGEISNTDVLYHYPLLHIKVLPSIIEGLSQSLLEAMAMGVPVIATRAAGNIDLIQHQQNGLLFDEGDSKTLAQYIEMLLGDKTLCAQLTLQARQTALNDFSIQRTIERYEQFFAHICATTAII
jgi:glycosyltransferase involved in cell wall biosynthesis